MKFNLGLFFRFVCALMLVCAFSHSHAQSSEAQEINQLIKAGKLDQAMQRADQALSAKPRDAQMRFLKGLIYTEQNKTNDAINMFVKLTDDYPELPEPYNNLAVLYASGGQYDKARGALEMAIRTHPSYATAHENLGDVYARLASQAYDKALQLDSANTATQTKLALVRDLVSGGVKPKPVVVAAATQTAPIKPTVPVSVPANLPPIAVVTKPEPVKTIVSNVGAAESDEQALTSRLKVWSQAWANQDVAQYFSYYTRNYKGQSSSHAAWQEDRRQRIEGKKKITVDVSEIQVQISGNTATVKFRQAYRADSLVANGRKTMVFTKTSGKWLIEEERVGG